MKTKFSGILTLLLAFVVQMTFAQEKTISGIISDQSGMPLPGVNIIVKGTTNGTQSDFDGNYTINASVGAVLTYVYIGLKPVERTIGTSNTIDVVMEESFAILDEVVVVGYSTTTRQSFTGTAKVVTSENIDAKSVSNIAQALAGEASGVSVTRTSGKPGAGASIRIRGFSSIEGNRSPLYVVDGVPFSGGVNSVNPSDIANTTILKDAAATAIYGSRGANGVIFITTKSGKSGKSYIEFDSKTTINMRSLANYDLINNEEEYIGLVYNQLKNTAEFNGSSNPTQDALDQLFDGNRGIAPLYNMWNVTNTSDLIDVSTGMVKSGVTRKFSPNDWADLGYRNGIRQEYNFKIAGGNEKTTHYFSLGYLNDEGYIRESQYDRYSTRLNLSTKATNWLKASTNISYAYSENNDATGYGGGVVTYMLDYTPTIYSLFLRDTAGNIVYNENTGQPLYDFADNVAGNSRGFSATYNGVGEAIYNIDKTTTSSLNANINLVADLFEGLTFETSYGINSSDSNLGRTRNSLQGSSGVALGGTLFLQQSRIIGQNFNQILRYKKHFGDNHNMNAFIAHETNEYSNSFYDLSRKGIVNLNPDAALNPSNYIDQNGVSSGFTNKSTLESYFGQLNYNYNSKYYFSSTIRRDGSSRFYKNKWGTFWSASAAWIVSKEDFLSSSEILNYLKLKVSYGVLGDQGNSFYQGQAGFNVENLLGQPSLPTRAVVDPNITWESSNQFQTGIEFELFDGRIEASVDYYIKKTTDLFVNKRLGPSTGDAIIRTNDGELLNKGLEFDLTGHLFKKEDFRLSVSINGEIFDNEVTKMPIENATGKPKPINISDRYGHSKGRSIYDFYIREWAGVNETNGNPQWTEHWVDENNNNQYDAGEGITDLVVYQSENPGQATQQRLTSTYGDATKKYINKSLIPTVRGAFRINASYKAFSLSAQLAYSIGGYGYDAQYANLMGNGKAGSSSLHIDQRNSWKKPGDITEVPRLYSNEKVRVNGTSSRFITSTDYLALSNLRLGYNLPNTVAKKIGIAGLNIWLSGDNLFLISNRTGYNPTTSITGTSGRYTYNPITSYTLGVRIKL
jgi:TonB-linked SusC/RagA family outer membrane protein